MKAERYEWKDPCAALPLLDYPGVPKAIEWLLQALGLEFIPIYGERQRRPTQSTRAYMVHLVMIGPYPSPSKGQKEGCISAKWERAWLLSSEGAAD